MERIRIFQVDAFADHVFKGNPAAVCILKEWLDDTILQSIGTENNLAETAFIIQREELFEIRWFTPTIEVELCGHATLASAYVIFDHLDYGRDAITFRTIRNEILRVKRNDNLLELDFPVDTYAPCEALPEICEGIGKIPAETYSSKYFYLAILESEDEVSGIEPDFKSIARLNKTGLIVSAPGKHVDFVSRFFAPQSGIDEDPVTGSAHTVLTPFWSERLKRKNLSARQISKRGGNLHCVLNDQRALIGGEARLYLKGEIFVP